MSMLHKAYALAWDAFEEDLFALLERGLRCGETTELVAFIDKHRAVLTDLATARPLGAGWRAKVDLADVQQLGDQALTRYYNLREERGLCHAWLGTEGALPPPVQAALLGDPIGGKTLFDPGKMGSYFRSAEQVQESLVVLREAEPLPVGEYRTDFDRFLKLLEECSERGCGVYITF